MAHVKKCNFKHSCMHTSRCPKMRSAVVNILQVPKCPFDHETRNITLDILMSPAGKVTVQNIIFYLVIMHKFCPSI